MADQNFLKDFNEFVETHPPKVLMTSKEVDEVILDNAEIFIELMKENYQKKNKNIVTSNQLNLITRLERNLVRLCKNTPATLSDPNAAKANKITLNKFIRRKR